MSATLPEYLTRLDDRGSKVARSAINKGRTLMPSVGATVRFDPICFVGRKAKKYAGHKAVVVLTSYERPEGNGSPWWSPSVYVEFADGFRYWLSPWHLVES